MQLSLDHLIIRSATPEATLAELAAQAGTPVLAGVEEVHGIASGIVRAGAIDIEVLRIGEEPPEEPRGYGLGFVADVGLDDAVAKLRELGIATSPAPRVSAGGRAWRATQLHGLLPDPFPAPTSTRRPGPMYRLGEAISGALGRIPSLARAATRRAGNSMVVVTEYEFDVAGRRASVEPGPRVVAVHVGTAGHRAEWERLPLNGGVELHLHDDAPAGVRRVVFERAAGAGAAGFALGDVAFDRA
jgi:hypothetical protein